MEKRYVTLKHLLVDEEKNIGLQYLSDKVLDALVNDLPGVKWSEQFRMNHIKNTPKNLDMLF